MTIHTLDLNFQNIAHTIASYLIPSSAGPILVEVGPGSTLDTLLQKLAEHGYEPKDVRHVFLTHIHLDHAGAAGWWAQQGAQLYVHHFGAKHLIDPSKLWHSASRIYGEEMEPLWGWMVPAPAKKVTAVYDEDTFLIGEHTFTALETPGHARHHHVWEFNDVAFSGDAAGIRMPACALVDIPAPPPEFDREAWLATIDLLQQRNYSALYPTHFDRLEDVDHQLRSMRDLISETAAFVKQHMDNDVPRAELIRIYRNLVWERGQALGMTDAELQAYEITNPLYMTVDGIMRYWQKRTA